LELFPSIEHANPSKRLTYAWQQTDAEVKVYIPFDQSKDTWMSAILDFFFAREKTCLDFMEWML